MVFTSATATRWRIGCTSSQNVIGQCSVSFTKESLGMESTENRAYSTETDCISRSATITHVEYNKVFLPIATLIQPRGARINQTCVPPSVAFTLMTVKEPKPTGSFRLKINQSGKTRCIFHVRYQLLFDQSIADHDSLAISAFRGHSFTGTERDCISQLGRYIVYYQRRQD